MKQYPAIDVRTDAADLLLAIVDDFRPTAVEEHDASVRIFFAAAADRDEAQRALASRFDVTARDISDEDWARRSQETLTPVTVGRVTIAPPWALDSPSPHPPAHITIVILPSMGF